MCCICPCNLEVSIFAGIAELVKVVYCRDNVSVKCFHWVVCGIWCQWLTECLGRCDIPWLEPKEAVHLYPLENTSLLINVVYLRNSVAILLKPSIVTMLPICIHLELTHIATGEAVL